MPVGSCHQTGSRIREWSGVLLASERGGESWPRQVFPRRREWAWTAHSDQRGRTGEGAGSRVTQEADNTVEFDQTPRMLDSVFFHY